MRESDGLNPDCAECGAQPVRFAVTWASEVDGEQVGDYACDREHAEMIAGHLRRDGIAVRIERCPDGGYGGEGDKPT